MNLKDLAKAAGGANPRTHAERLMVLSQVSSEAMPYFMDTLQTKDPAGWMQTLMDIGALDLGTELQRQVQSKHAEIVSTWSFLATAFVEMVGKGTVRKAVPEDETSPEDAAPRVSFTKDPAILSVFNAATDRLCEQASQIPAARVRSQIGGKFISSDVMTGTLSLWMSMACALDQPNAVKKLADSFPSSMAVATRLASKCLETLKFRERNKAFGTSTEEMQFVSPLLVAMHVGSTRCIDALMAKRKELSCTLNAPLISLDDSGNPHRNLLEAETLNQLVKAVTPKVIVHAVLPRVIHDPQSLKYMVQEQMHLVEKNPHLFHAFAKAGLLHSDNETTTFNSLERAIWHAPRSIPEFLKRMDWDALLPRLGTRASPIYRAMNDVGKLTDSQKLERESAVLSLIRSAQSAGHGDAALQTFFEFDRFRQKIFSPVSQLSSAGFERLTVLYLDHGFDPKKRPEGGGLSLLDIANRDQHPTFGAILAHTARRRAHDLISEIENEPMPRGAP